MLRRRELLCTTGFSILSRRRLFGREEPHLVFLQDDYQRWPIRPVQWDGGRFFVLPIYPGRGEAHAYVHGADGQLLTSIVLDMPDAPDLKVFAAAASGTGFVLSAHAWGRTSRSAAMLCVVDSNGRLQQIVHTNPFLAIQMRSAPDGSIWALGKDIITGEGTSKTEILRHYGVDGTLSGAYLPRGLFPRPTHPVSLSSSGPPLLHAGAERIGMYLSGAGEWVDVDASGQSIQRMRLAFPSTTKESTGRVGLLGVSMTLDEEVIGWIQAVGFSGYYRLARATGCWERLSFNDRIANLTGLYGMQGNQVLVRHGIRSANSGAFQWISLSEILGRAVS